ncbi:MAG: CDP-diacylglycerol--glycerol-3-phosphate 3-phosphatidyltransferase [Candidatus Cloacimonadota bacterium]|nr:MAG: CDP-diacylglycerol--glycerol-3-phosphate 3-phosphatidyltransferase [Candidatus Cloacimonadota bacterium]
MKKQIPNILTLIRIILVPVFIWLVFSSSISNNILLATIVFLLASITDYFDGMLARRYKIISNFGKIMDPLADKILVISALFALSLQLKFINIIVVIIIIFREIAVSVLRNYYAGRGIYIAANIWGKLKTFTQMTGIVISLIFASAVKNSIFLQNIDKNFRVGINIYFWIVAGITLLSGLNYFMIKFKKEK